jgi:hypothetical protein
VHNNQAEGPHRGWLIDCFAIAARNPASLPLGIMLCSSNIVSRPNAFRVSIKSNTSWLSGNSMCCHAIPSSWYSNCFVLKMNCAHHTPQGLVSGSTTTKNVHCITADQVEVLLERFIGVIDTQLLKRVFSKCFKAKDVKHANEPVAWSVHRRVYPLHYPVKHARVHDLRKGVTGFHGLHQRSITRKERTKLEPTAAPLRLSEDGVSPLSQHEETVCATLCRTAFDRNRANGKRSRQTRWSQDP